MRMFLERPISSIRQDGGQGVGPEPPRPVEHLGLQLAELVLQVGELVGQGLDDGRVPGADGCVVRGAQVLGPWGQESGPIWQGTNYRNRGLQTWLCKQKFQFQSHQTG